MIEKGCNETCKHEGLNGREEPCYSCALDKHEPSRLYAAYLEQKKLADYFKAHSDFVTDEFNKLQAENAKLLAIVDAAKDYINIEIDAMKTQSVEKAREAHKRMMDLKDALAKLEGGGE